MKYIIDLPEEFAAATQEYWEKTVGLELEPYLESDRGRIENEVWDFVKKIECLTICEIKDCFDVEYEGIPFIANMFSFQEAKDKYEEWERQKNEIKVGDEIVGIYSDGEKSPPLVVLKVEGNYYYGIYSKTGEFVQGGLNYEKTGRYFPEVGQMLEKIKEEKND